MKITRQQLRKLILKEFRDIGNNDFENIDINVPPMPPTDDEGGGPGKARTGGHGGEGIPLPSAHHDVGVQINGKVRARIDAPADADKAALEQLAMGAPNAQRFLDGMTVRKVIVVPGKLVNIVVSG